MVIIPPAIDELGMFLRLQMDCAIVLVPNSNRAGMSRTFTLYYRTAHKGVHQPFKPGSLYKFFYQMDLATIKSVRSAIKRMLDKLEDYENR